MQSINYAVYDADLEGGEVYFSESLRKMLGMKPDDPAYTTGNIIETIHPDDRPAYREAIVDAFQGRHAALRGRFPLSRRRRQLALVPPVRRRGPASGRACVSDRRRDVRRHRDAPARPRARDRQGRGGRRLSAGRQRGRADDADRRALRARDGVDQLRPVRLGHRDRRDLFRAQPAHPARPPLHGAQDHRTTGASASIRPTIRCSAAGWSSISRARPRASSSRCAISPRTGPGAGRASTASRSAGRTAARGGWSAPPRDITEHQAARMGAAVAQSPRRNARAFGRARLLRCRIALRARARIDQPASTPAPTTPTSRPAWSISRRQLQEVLSLPEYGPITAWADVIHPDDRPQHTRMVAALYRGEIPRLDVEFRYRAQDGTWKWARQHGVVVRGPDGRARRMVGVTGEITETRQRERQFDAASAEAFAAHRDVEQAREIMQTVLDNMSDGVTLWDKDFRWQFSNRRHMESWGYTPEQLHPGISGREMIRFQIMRGALRRDRGDLDSRVDEVAERMLKPGGNRYTRRIENGRYIEFNFNRLNDGSLLGVYRDITELKEREEALAAAKEAAEAARNDVERTREIMQTVLDNMSDGVMLFDEQMRWQFTNRQLTEFQRFTEDLARPGVVRLRHPGVPGAARRFRPDPGIGHRRGGRAPDRDHARRRALRAPHRERPVHRVHLQAARRRQPARDLSRHHRIEGPRGSARGRQGGGRSRARRRRAHAPHHADRARQHDRRRHVVRQGFPPAVPQPAGDGIPELSAPTSSSPGFPARISCATR